MRGSLLSGIHFQCAPQSSSKSIYWQFNFFWRQQRHLNTSFLVWPCNGNLLLLLGQSCISKHVIYFQKGNYRSDTLLLTFQQAFWVADSNSEWNFGTWLSRTFFWYVLSFFLHLESAKIFPVLFQGLLLPPPPLPNSNIFNISEIPHWHSGGKWETVKLWCYMPNKSQNSHGYSSIYIF